MGKSVVERPQRIINLPREVIQRYTYYKGVWHFLSFPHKPKLQGALPGIRKVKFVKYALGRVLSETSGSDPPPFSVPWHNNYPIISEPTRCVLPVHRNRKTLPLRILSQGRNSSTFNLCFRQFVASCCNGEKLDALFKKRKDLDF